MGASSICRGVLTPTCRSCRRLSAHAALIQRSSRNLLRAGTWWTWSGSNRRPSRQAGTRSATKSGGPEQRQLEPSSRMAQPVGSGSPCGLNRRPAQTYTGTRDGGFSTPRRFADSARPLYRRGGTSALLSGGRPECRLDASNTPPRAHACRGVCDRLVLARYRKLKHPRPATIAEVVHVRLNANTCKQRQTLGGLMGIASPVRKEAHLVPTIAPAERQSSVNRIVIVTLKHSASFRNLATSAERVCKSSSGAGSSAVWATDFRGWTATSRSLCIKPSKSNHSPAPATLATVVCETGNASCGERRLLPSRNRPKNGMRDRPIPQ